MHLEYTSSRSVRTGSSRKCLCSYMSGMEWPEKLIRGPGVTNSLRMAHMLYEARVITPRLMTSKAKFLCIGRS